MKNEIPIHLQPKVWYDLYVKGKEPKYWLFVDLMSCMQDSEIAPVFKYLPANLFQEFKSTLADWAEIEKEEDFVIVGSEPAPWGLKDVWRVKRWLEGNPNPELAAAVENVPDD